MESDLNFNNLKIGSIVMLMKKDYSIFKGIIIQNNIIIDNVKYDYLLINYPFGFIGVDNFYYIDKEYIHEVIYNSKRQLDKNNQLGPSGIIKNNQEEYLVIGKNVRYLGKEKENEYACIKIGNEIKNGIDYIKEKEIEEIISYGYKDNEYEKLDKDRYKITDEILRTYRAFLPIGSVVQLTMQDDEEIEIMIIGRNIKTEEGMADYMGIEVETTFKGNDCVVLFDKQQIDHIKYVNYFNEEERYLNEEILISRGILNRREK